MKKVAFVSIIALALGFLAKPASAITYGQLDNGKHPAVGALIRVRSNGEMGPYCSGALIAPQVFLTAAHCASYGPDVMVMFDDAYVDGETEIYHGTIIANPHYKDLGHQNDTFDVAVVVFEDPLGIDYVSLPTAGALDDLENGQSFTSVGYGTQEPTPAPGGIVNAYYGTREYAVGTLHAVTKAWLHISQNPATGDGGTCYGDSGGPNFIGGGDGETQIVGAITVTGDAFCHATNWTYRVDTESAREFLGEYVDLP